MGLKKAIATMFIVILTFVAITLWMTSGLGLDPLWAALIGAAAVFGEIIISIKLPF